MNKCNLLAACCGAMQFECIYIFVIVLGNEFGVVWLWHSLYGILYFFLELQRKTVEIFLTYI